MTNIIRGVVHSGKYKDQNIRIDIGKTGADTFVYIGGKQIKNIELITIKLIPNKLNRIHIEMFGGYK